MPTIPTFSLLGTGPTVLMLHGIGGGHLAFAPQLETLASAGYRAVAWNMPGYGRSAPIDPYTFKGLAESCLRLIDALSGEREGGIVLVGHSMGGMVAQEVMARRPQGVRKLVLCGTSAAFGPRQVDGRLAEGWVRRFMDERLAPLEQGVGMAALAERLIPRMIGPGAQPDGVRLATHCLASVPAATYRRALECLLTFDRRAALAAIRVPTLLVAGGAMQGMARQMAQARYVEMAGVGHLMPLEDPDAFGQLLLEFLREPDAPAGVVLH
jgi:3-oxoadipate enol-lactonase